jgi:hypothetical protein
LSLRQPSRVPSAEQQQLSSPNHHSHQQTALARADERLYQMRLRRTSQAASTTTATTTSLTTFTDTSASRPTASRSSPIAPIHQVDGADDEERVRATRYYDAASSRTRIGAPLPPSAGAGTSNRFLRATASSPVSSTHQRHPQRPG